MRSRLSLAGVALLLALLTACSFTTANLSSFKLGKDKEVTTETSKFGPNDEIWAKAVVSNVPSKVTLKFGLILVKVEGQPENTRNPGTDYSVDLPSSGTGTYHLTPPPSGWPAGQYRVEVAMITDSGEQKDQKTAEFTVSGNNANSSTANISSFKLGKDEDVSSETTTFGPKDEVWAKTKVSNVPSKITLKYSLTLVKVEGQPENAHNDGTDYSVDMASSGTGTYHLTPPASGWPAGKYRVNVAMLTDSGEQKDQKTAEFTVSGN